MRTLGQKRAEFALNEVLGLELPEDDKKNFKSFTAGAPSMILQNGFGQTMAFWLSKSDSKKHRDLFNIVKKWLTYNNSSDVKNEFVKYENPQNNSDKDFILAISKMDQAQYLAAQNEALKLLEWVKRYASADFIKGIYYAGN